jgi:hypothetical protein
MSIFDKIDKKVTPYSNGLLLLLASGFLFMTPFFPVSLHKVVGQVFFSLIFFASVFALDTGRRAMWVIAVTALVTEWLGYWTRLPLVYYGSTMINIVFFQVIVIKLLIQIAKSRKTDASIILESINGYLMMGLMFTSWVAIAMAYDPGAFNFYTDEPVAVDYAYFTFVTMTTLGYGDVTPQLPFARSLAMLISTAGQMYVAVIIAMLVGKYAGAGSKKN